MSLAKAIEAAEIIKSVQRTIATMQAERDDYAAKLAAIDAELAVLHSAESDGIISLKENAGKA